MAQYPLAGRSLFITGGANGIGAATARLASQRGARVAIVDVDGEAAERLAAQLPDAIACRADVRDMASIERAAQATVEAFGGIDVAMANAGVGTVGTVESLSMDQVEAIVDVNLGGVLRTVKATLPHVIERRGYVLLTASLAAILYAPPLIHYTATKAAVEAFGNALRVEMTGRGVDVGVAYFGFIETAMVAAGDAHPVIADFQTRRRFKGPLEKRYPVETAGRAVVKGIESRTRRMFHPSWLRGVHLLRAAMPRVTERAMKREGVDELVAQLNAAPGDGVALTPATKD